MIYSKTQLEENYDCLKTITEESTALNTYIKILVDSIVQCAISKFVIKSDNYNGLFHRLHILHGTLTRMHNVINLQNGTLRINYLNLTG